VPATYEASIAQSDSSIEKPNRPGRFVFFLIADTLFSKPVEFNKLKLADRVSTIKKRAARPKSVQGIEPLATNSNSLNLQLINFWKLYDYVYDTAYVKPGIIGMARTVLIHR
jgi:hypothetical protein